MQLRNDTTQKFMTTDFAPILITTLNRYDHFKKCIKSLSECELCLETDLYIALDYPLRDLHWEGYNEIQKFIKCIEGFKSVNVIKREYNFGAQNNTHDAINFLFKDYESLILTEDDNLFSKDFLVFINRCLQTYKGDSNIFSVCGYNYPVEFNKSYKEQIYVWQGHSAWGTGLWRDKFQKVDWSPEVVLSNVQLFLKDYRKVFGLNTIANSYIPALIHMSNVKQIHGDTYVCLYQYLNKMSSVFPVISRVRNMGHDGSGINGGFMEEDIFSVQKIYRGSSHYEIPKFLKPEKYVDKILYNHFKTNWKSNIKLFIKLILFNLGFKWVKK
jgi:hypothetical protein